MNNNAREIRACLTLLCTAIIWGFGMAAQQKAAMHLGPFTYNALRFTVAALTVLPFMLFKNKKENTPVAKQDLKAGAIVGCVLFTAALCQQAGVGETGAGKGGFITSLYCVLVPVLGIFLKQKTSFSTWLALVVALPGLYLLCIPAGEKFLLAKGDIWMLTGSLFWAFHILTTDHFGKKTTSFKLCVIQFSVTAALNFICALMFEEIRLDNIIAALLPMLYCGAVSNGMGFLFQTLGQRHAKPAHASLILCLESVFSAIAGAIFLHERLGMRGYTGCLLMLVAVVLSQLGMLKKAAPAERIENHV